MSDDPKRLLDSGSGASAAERDLLRSAGDVEPAADASAAMWAALATRLPPPGGGAPPAAGPAGGGGAATGSTLGAKAVALGLIGVVIAIGAAVLLRSPETPPPASPASASASALASASPSASASASVLAFASAPASAPMDPPPAPHPTTKSPPASGAPSSSNDALRDEIALVAAARAALRRGDGPGALATLDTARKQHPRGALLQEREVLTIEALAQSGDTQGASRRASAFLRAFPTSPHAAHVRTFER
jgi:hypothetical protein